MGFANTRLKLKNPRRPDVQAVEVDALADTGAIHLCIPESIRDRLALEGSEERVITLVDGSSRSVPYVGPVELLLHGRRGFTGALVMGEQTLLGVVPMEDLDLVVVPKTRQVMPNPANPDVAGSLALRTIPRTNLGASSRTTTL